RHAAKVAGINRLPGKTPEHGDELLAGDGRSRVLTVGDTVGDDPLLGLGVPGVAAGGVNAAHAGDDGPDHRAGQRVVGGEDVGVHAVHELVIVDVLHRGVVPSGGRHVVERELGDLRLLGLLRLGDVGRVG